MDASLQVLDCYNRSRHKKRNPVVATFILPEFVNYVSFFLRNLLYLIVVKRRFSLKAERLQLLGARKKGCHA